MNRNQLRDLHAFALKAIGQLLARYGRVSVYVIKRSGKLVALCNLEDCMRITTLFEDVSRIPDNTILDNIFVLNDRLWIVQLKEICDEEVEG